MSGALANLAADPRALRVCKKPVSVPAEFAAQDGVCETLEGPVRFQAGDAILTGVKGERWPVRRELFLSSYRPVPPTQSGENGRYIKLSSITHALRADRACDVPVGWQRDPLHAKPGDWLMRYADGSFGVIQDSVFRESYEPAPGETRWPP